MAEGFRDDGTARGLDDEGRGEKLAEAIALAGGDGVEETVEVGRADLQALSAGFLEELEKARNGGDGGGGALGGEPVVAGNEFEAEHAFGVPEVFVVPGVQLGEMTRIREVQGFGRHTEGV